jgi:hypothetical protein
MFKKLMAILAITVFLVSCSSPEGSSGSGIFRRPLTTEEARGLAEQKVEFLYQYVQYKGHNIQLEDQRSIGEDNFEFIFTFDISTDILPAKQMRATVPIIDGEAGAIQVEEITE